MPKTVQLEEDADGTPTAHRFVVDRIVRLENTGANPIRFTPVLPDGSRGDPWTLDSGESLDGPFVLQMRRLESFVPGGTTESFEAKGLKELTFGQASLEAPETSGGDSDGGSDGGSTDGGGGGSGPTKLKSTE